MEHYVNFDEIGITNDIMFGSVFKDTEHCKGLLERILGFRIENLEIVEQQKNVKLHMDAKGIRLDIYAKDYEGNAYDIEMQVANTRDLELRSRYYHSEMDGFQIRSGQRYSSLKASIVIFICAFDMFGENRSIYTFESYCREDRTILLNDKRRTIFVNIFGNRAGLDEGMENLLDFFKDGIPKDEFTEGLRDEVERTLDDNEWRTAYMTLEMMMEAKMEEKYEEGLMKGEARGEAKGLTKERTRVINHLRTHGMDIQDIAECMDLHVEEIRELFENMDVN